MNQPPLPLSARIGRFLPRFVRRFRFRLTLYFVAILAVVLAAFSIFAACTARNVSVGCVRCFASTGRASRKPGFVGDVGISDGDRLATRAGMLGFGVAGFARVVVVALRRALTVTPGFGDLPGVARCVVATGGKLSLGGVRAA